MDNPKEVARKLARDTIPDDNNEDVMRGMLKGANIIEQFHNETNGWFDIHDVRVYGENEIGIVADWKWTIERWISSNAEEMLLSNGWTDFAHLKADRDKEPNEAEFRYKKDYGSTVVWLNCYIEFTERVFDALEKGKERVEYGAKETAERVKKVREIMDEDKKWYEMRRVGSAWGDS